MISGLAGRVVVITGAGSGIGLATARAMAAEGASVVGADLDADGLRTFSTDLGDRGVPLVADISTPDGANAVVETATKALGRLDVLVACAGVYETHGVADIDAETWDRVMDVNLRGTFLCAQAAMKVMGDQGWGRIITLSSIAAMTGGMAAGPAYVTSKAGVMGMTRSLAHAAGPLGITVNCVHPGVIETPMTGAMSGATKSSAAEKSALGRTGTAEEVAAVIVLLASDATSFVTGAHLSVNGGLFMD